MSNTMGNTPVTSPFIEYIRKERQRHSNIPQTPEIDLTGLKRQIFSAVGGMILG
jgi:hypothetical protein